MVLERKTHRDKMQKLFIGREMSTGREASFSIKMKTKIRKIGKRKAKSGNELVTAETQRMPKARDAPGASV